MSSDTQTVTSAQQQPPNLAQAPRPVQPAQNLPLMHHPQPMIIPMAASPPMYYSMAAQGIPPMMPAVRYVPQAGAVQFVAAPPQPTPYVIQQPPLSSIAPNDYLPMVIVMTIICGLLQFTSLLMGMPAVLCALQAAEAKRAYNFSKTKTMALTALILTVFNVLYTIVSIALIIGLSVGLSYH